MFIFKFTQKNVFPARCYYYLGEVCELIHEIENGRGKIRASDGMVWTVTGEDCPINTKVKVIEVVKPMLFRVKALY